MINASPIHFSHRKHHDAKCTSDASLSSCSSVHDMTTFANSNRHSVKSKVKEISNSRPLFEADKF